jgi:predicted molibdopterin-dependent oxidoreductase YjgC
MTAAVTVYINGAMHHVRSGLSVASALLEKNCGPVLRHTEVKGAPRGVFCNMGVCFDCLVTIDGRGNVRACMTTVADGMRITTS